MKSPSRFDVEISNVREVSLLGTADLRFWRDRLESQALVPTNAGGAAEVLICGSAMRFMGVPFRELTFSVFVSDEKNGAARDGAYLVHAFSSFWPFALIERTILHTPYYYGQIQVDPRLPASLRYASGGEMLLEAIMTAESASGRPRLRCGLEGWKGPIHLPSRTPDSRKSRLFFGKIEGMTEVFAFDATRDLLKLASKEPILTMLQDSNFSPQEWIIRPSATHGKGKTVRRMDVQQPRTPSAI